MGASIITRYLRRSLGSVPGEYIILSKVLVVGLFSGKRYKLRYYLIEKSIKRKPFEDAELLKQFTTDKNT